MLKHLQNIVPLRIVRSSRKGTDDEKEEADYINHVGLYAVPKKLPCRQAEKNGLLRADREIKAARAALHFWEEPCISGDNGSGTVFSGCVLNLYRY